MFLPYSDEPSEPGTPWVNWLLIAANVYFFLTLGLDEGYDRTIQQWGFTPSRIYLSTLITSMFLHANVMHLAGNMWFLYLFGDNVECKVGHLRYLVAYLLAGIGGDLSHFLFFHQSDIPSIGASGAIFGVLGMYIVLFPLNRVKVIYILIIFIGTFAMRAFWIIGAFFLLELLYSRLQTMSGAEGGIGHLAHAGGFVAGAALALFMLVTGMVSGRRRDLLAYATNRADIEPEETSNREQARQAFPILPQSDAAADNDDFAYQLAESDPRYNIIVALHSGKTQRAIDMWREYAFQNLDGVLPVREQFQMAQALDQSGALALARDAYERLLAYYKDHQPYTAEAQLSLAGMLLQHAQESGDTRDVAFARKLLKNAADTHPQHSRRELARSWLQKTEAMRTP
ncbi:MAG TPA: rhomboid family intramembrane serine protease [Planctomycetota bacterium]|nr:rhomboid family intramembrane serine protease [Planctomycetota bacterium]